MLVNYEAGHLWRGVEAVSLSVPSPLVYACLYPWMITREVVGAALHGTNILSSTALLACLSGCSSMLRLWVLHVV